MQVISSLSELANKIDECNEVLANQPDDAMRRLFHTFRMDFSREAPADPFSPEYREFQLAIYQRIAGKSYTIDNERSNFDTAGKAGCPFPYYLRSAWTAGHHLLAIGFMLCKLDLPAGSRILEFGPGWGNTTMELARIGFEVTAIDIEPNFCDVIRALAAQIGVSAEVVAADFFWIEQTDRVFDAALFFASFHHCHDHMRLLRSLHRVVAPGGRVYLASESVISGYGTPWGVRIDGEALWAMRNFGWLELGFDEAYFREALARTGWQGTRHDCLTVPWASVWELRRADEGPVDRPGPAAAARVEVPPPPEVPAEILAGRQALIELDAVYRSTSWRLTAPLRAMRRALSPR